MAAAQVASDFLRDEAEKLKAKLEASEEKLQKYKEEQNAVSLQEDQNITVAKLKELSVRSVRRGPAYQAGVRYGPPPEDV